MRCTRRAKIFVRCCVLLTCPSFLHNKSAIPLSLLLHQHRSLISIFDTITMHRIRRFTSLAIQHAPRSSDPFSVPLLLAPGTSSHQSHNTHNNTSQPHNHIASPKKQSEQHIHRNKPPNHHIIPIEETTYEVAQYRITHPPWNRTKRPRIENEDDQKFKLTKTQEHVLHSAMKGENIFFTGKDVHSKCNTS